MYIAVLENHAKAGFIHVY